MRASWPFLLALLVAGCDGASTAGPAKTNTRDAFGADDPRPGGSGSVDYGARRALVVGINAYPSTSLADLTGPSYDAAEVAAVLADRFGFSVRLVVDQAPSAALPAGVTVDRVPVVTRALLLQRLADLKGAATPKDALLFYYAGHGLPGLLVPGDADLPSRTDRKSWTNLLPLEELAKALRACDAHHTLAILDSCFSGSALAEGAPMRPAVGTLGPAALRVSEAENLGRVFNRRAFQVITAGAGDEKVGDLAEAAEAYSALPKDLEGHSPFTGVLLQGLRGLTGRPDGIVAASDLAYWLTHTLVNENASFRAKQAPRFGAMGGGEGDFLLLPVKRVLNPLLVAPLYAAGAEYADLRASACDALVRFVAQQPEPERAPLVGAAVPHVVRLLKDAEEKPRVAAARALAGLAPHGPGELQNAIAPLTRLLSDSAQPAEARGQAARALGACAMHADDAASAAVGLFVASLERTWTEALAAKPVPAEIVPRILAARIEVAPADAAAPRRMELLERKRDLFAWLATEGVRILGEWDRRHQLARTFHLRGRRATDAGDPAQATLLFAEANRIDPSPLYAGLAADSLTRAGRLTVYTEDSQLTAALSSDGARVTTVRSLTIVRRFDAETAKPLGPPLIVPSRSDAPVAVSGDGALLAIGTGTAVDLYDLSAGRLLPFRPMSHAEPYVRVYFGGRHLSCIDSRGGIDRWSMEGVRTRVDPVGSERLLTMTLSLDGRKLLQVDQKYQYLLYDIESGSARRGELPLKERPASVTLSEEGAICTVTGKSVQLWTPGESGVAPRGPGFEIETADVIAVSTGGDALGLCRRSGFERRTISTGALVGKALPLGVPVPGTRLLLTLSKEGMRYLDIDSGAEASPLFAGRDKDVTWLLRCAGLATATREEITLKGGALPRDPAARSSQAMLDRRTLAIVETGVARQVYDTATGATLEVAFLHDEGEHRLSGNGDLLYCVKESMVMVGGAELPRGENGAVHCSYDGTVVVVSDGTKLRWWNAKTGVRELEGSESCGSRACFTTDGEWFAASGEGRVRVWNLAAGTSPKEFGVETSPVFALSPSGRYFAVAAGAGVDVYRLESWEKASTILLPAPPTSITFGPRDKRVALLDHRGTLTLAEAHSGSPAGTIILSAKIRGVVMDRNAERMLLTSSEGAAWMWDVNSWRVSRTFVCRDAAYAAISQDGSKVVLLSREVSERQSTQRLQVWAADKPSEGTKLGETWITAVAAGADGVVAACGPELWWVPFGGTPRRVAETGENGVEGLALAPDGKRVAVTTRNETKVLEMEAGRTLATFGPIELAHWTAFAPDGKRVAIYEKGNKPELRLWEIESGKATSLWKDEEWTYSLCAATPDLSKLVLYHTAQRRRPRPDGKRLRIFGASGGAESGGLPFDESVVPRTVVISADGKRAGILSETSFVLLSFPEGVPVGPAIAIKERIQGIRLHPSRPLVALFDKTLVVYDCASGQPLLDTGIEGANPASVTFAGDRLVVGQGSGALAILDLGVMIDPNAAATLTARAALALARRFGEAGEVEMIPPTEWMLKR